jgi:steroid delta-isomerase-like uncharacterized protein
LADQFYTDDVVLYSPHSPVPLHGRDGIYELLSMLHESYPDFHVELHDILMQGDKAALRFTVTGTDTGGSFGFPPSGKTFKASETEFVRLAPDGRISEVRFNINLMDIMQQLQLMPPGPPPKALLAFIKFTQKVRHPFGGPRPETVAEPSVPLSAETVVSGGSGGVPALVVADGARLGERFPVAGELSLGREGADVVLDDPEVSRRHAVVRFVAGVLEISDANSANGTFVNGRRVDGVGTLADGDSLRLGGTTLAVELPVVRPQAAAPVLVVTEGAGAGADQRFEVDTELSLGRVDADVLLDDVEVSRRHAIVRFSDGALEISDADSANGTFVNGSRIGGSHPLADGDLIRLGKTTLRVELPRLSAATVIATAGAKNTVVAPPPGT